MKPNRRLTRRESQEQTRAKLIEAAEKVFIRSGFGASSVERIAEAAGFSRGAFYSNFDSKDELFLAVLNKRRLDTANALDEIFHQESSAGDRTRAVRDWYVQQQQRKEWIILETEFHLRALRNRTVRKRLSDLRSRELATYSALVAQHFAEAGIPMADRPETVALSMLAVAVGLGSLSLTETGGEDDRRFAEARNLVFNRLIGMDGAAISSTPR